MSDISISNQTIASIAQDAQLSGGESVKESSHTLISNADRTESHTMEQAIVGPDTVSKTQDYSGAGPDYSSTGTDMDFQLAVNSAIMNGTGTIADKIV